MGLQGKAQSWERRGGVEGSPPGLGHGTPGEEARGILRSRKWCDWGLGVGFMDEDLGNGVGGRVRMSDELSQ